MGKHRNYSKAIGKHNKTTRKHSKNIDKQRTFTGQHDKTQGKPCYIFLFYMPKQMSTPRGFKPTIGVTRWDDVLHVYMILVRFMICLYWIVLSLDILSLDSIILFTRFLYRMVLVFVTCLYYFGTCCSDFI